MLIKKDRYYDQATTLTMILYNAAGAEFENEDMAIAILAEYLKRASYESEKSNQGQADALFILEKVKGHLLNTLTYDETDREDFERVENAIKWVKKQTRCKGLKHKTAGSITS